MAGAADPRPPAQPRFVTVGKAHTCFIVNKAAGSVREPEGLTRKLRDRFPDAKCLFPRKPGEAISLARKARRDGCQQLIAAGGDGTLNEVINGLDGDFAGLRVGLLPLGTGNDFARSIGVPRALDDALDVLARNRAARIDVVRVTNDRRRYMMNVSAGGFSAKVDEKLTEDVKERWGPLAYARSFVAALPELKDYRTDITLDDAELLDTPAHNVIVANGRYVAGGVPIAPRARLDDGLLDIIVLPLASLPKLALLAPATLLGKHLDNDQLIFRRARKVRVSSDPAMHFNTDGELIGHGPVTFEVLPRAIEFIVGDPEPGAIAPG